MASKRPDGFPSVIPYIVADGAGQALAHYEKALGATAEHVMNVPGTDKVMHACFTVGDSKLFMCDPNETMQAPADGRGGSHFYVYVDDVDAAHARAVKAGMKEGQPPTDMFWGDRMSSLTCRYGHTWSLATHTRDVTPEEMAKAMQADAG